MQAPANWRDLGPVHPRACGEHLASPLMVRKPSGSSPRVRGTLYIVRCLFLGLSVHPRACGEHPSWLSVCARKSGSSPRVRGTLTQGQDIRGLGRFIPARAGNIDTHIPRDFRGRFIPARAGNMSSWNRARDYSTVHPRACGEHRITFGRIAYRCGSSPRVRGTYWHHASLEESPRFIPARAGNMQRKVQVGKWRAVHPRACGEHRFADQGVIDDYRFIPARAGNIPRRALRRIGSTVHPRACGEHFTQLPSDFLDFGSSPRVRGTLSRIDRAVHGRRFIPARAGNIRNVLRLRAACSVHPRACGEHFRTGGSVKGLYGSSPRVRGTCDA